MEKIKQMAKLWVEVNRHTKSEREFFLHFRTLFEKEVVDEWQDWCAAPEHWVSYEKVEKSNLMKPLLDTKRG